MQPWQDEAIEAIRQQHRAFAEKELAPGARERDREGGLPKDAWRKCAEHGVFGLCMDPAYGGAGKPVTHAVAAIEGLSYGCPDGGFVYALASQIFGIQRPLQLLASEELKKRYLPGLISGELLGAHAFTEEEAGSDAFSMSTRAVRTQQGFTLDGHKRFITNALDSDLILVFARTGEGRSPFDLTAFLVEATWPGVSKGREFEKMGLRTVRMGEFAFEKVAIPETHVVSGVGRGFRVLTETTGWERAVLFATALGPMARTIDECVERSRTRQQFGKPIGSFQQVSAKIADMVSRFEISRLLVYDLASRLDAVGNAQSVAQMAAIAKLFISEANVQLNLDALNLFGVRGYLVDSAIGQRLRDSLSGEIWAGTSDVLRNMIAKLAGVPVS